MNKDNICLPTNYVLLILCILIGISTLYIYINSPIKNNIENNNIPIKNNIKNNIENNSNNIPTNNIPINNETLNNSYTIPINNETLNNSYNIPINNKTLNNSYNVPINIQNDLYDNTLNNSYNVPINIQNDLYDIRKKIILDKRDRDVINDNFKPPERRLPFHAYPENIKNLINIPSRGYPDNHHLIGLVIRDNTETAYNLFGRQTYPGSNQYEYYVQKTGINDNVKIPIQIKGNKEIEDGQIVDIIGTNKVNGTFTTKLYDYNSPKYNPYII